MMERKEVRMRSSPAPSTHSGRRFAAEDGVHAWRACGSRAAAWFSGRGKPVGRRSNCFLSTRGRVHGIRDDDGTYVRRRKPAGQAVNVPAVIQAEKKSVPNFRSIWRYPELDIPACHVHVPVRDLFVTHCQPLAICREIALRIYPSI